MNVNTDGPILRALRSCMITPQSNGNDPMFHIQKANDAFVKKSPKYFPFVAFLKNRVFSANFLAGRQAGRQAGRLEIENGTPMMTIQFSKSLQ